MMRESTMGSLQSPMSASASSKRASTGHDVSYTTVVGVDTPSAVVDAADPDEPGSPQRAPSRSNYSLAFQSCVESEGFEESLRDGERRPLLAAHEPNYITAGGPSGSTIDVQGWAGCQTGAPPAALSLPVTAQSRHAATVCFADITLPNPLGGYLLQKVSGILLPGKLTAVLGSDEAEVHALATLVAGELDEDEYKGTLYYNQCPTGTWYRKCIVGFARLRAEVVLSTALTVRQNLLYSLQLHLSLKHDEENRAVERVLEVVGLQDKAGVRVVELDTEGKMRLSIAQELLVDPPVLLVEFASAGLSYSSSLAIMRMLKHLADTGKTVGVMLHQPRWAVYSIVDNLVLIHGGQLAYFGRAGEEAIEFFQARGMIWNRNYTPTDFLLQLCATDEAGWSRAGENPRMEPAALAADFLSSSEYQTLLHPYLVEVASPKHQERTALHFTPPSFTEPSEFGRLVILIKCTARRAMSRWGWSLLRALLVTAAVFVMANLYKSSTSQQGLQNRVGITFFAILLLMLINVPYATHMIRIRPTFLHQRASGSYTTLTFWIVQLLWELLLMRLVLTALVALLIYWVDNDEFTNLCGILCITQCAFFSLSMAVGSIATSVNAASTGLTALCAFFTVSGGLLINSTSIPSWMDWIEKLSFFRYAYESLLVDLFLNKEFDCYEPTNHTKVPGCYTGNDYLQLQGFNTSLRGAWYNMAILGGITAGLLTMSLLGLWVMKPPLVVSRQRKVWYQALYDVARALWSMGYGEIPKKMKKEWGGDPARRRATQTPFAAA